MSDVLNRLFCVEGKVALVTGGSSGIGRMMAAGLVDAGARVYIVARNSTRCESVAEELSANGAAVAIAGDLSTLAGVRSVAAAVSDRERMLHILVNNAGLLQQAPIDDYDEAAWDGALALNLKAAFFLSQAMLPLLRAAGDATDPARIVNISSGHGLRISPFDHFGYSASKAGLNHLTRALAQKLAGEHVNVNAIAPGMFASALTADFPEELVDRIKQGIPQHRLGQSDDIVGTLLYLVSRAGAYTTSTVLPVDGGWAGIG